VSGTAVLNSRPDVRPADNPVRPDSRAAAAGAAPRLLPSALADGDFAIVDLTGFDVLFALTGCGA
jgi:hypothetical protein